MCDETANDEADSSQELRLRETKTRDVYELIILLAA
jgi:hypothetical protein